jgi:hypothetical protein
MNVHTHLIVAAVAWGLLSAPASAQGPREPAVPAQSQAPKLDPKACSGRDRLKQGDIVETDGRARTEEPLSDKLARTETVICPPPGLGPHIRAPAPHTGSDMPVIEPSASAAEPRIPRK